MPSLRFCCRFGVCVTSKEYSSFLYLKLVPKTEFESVSLDPRSRRIPGYPTSANICFINQRVGVGPQIPIYFVCTRYRATQTFFNWIYSVSYHAGPSPTVCFNGYYGVCTTSATLLPPICDQEIGLAGWLTRQLHPRRRMPRPTFVNSAIVHFPRLS